MNDQLLEHIIERCKMGDTTAQTELYRRFYKGMYNVSLRILNHSAEAEDAMQEAFIAAFKQIDSYRGEVTFGSWLKRIVINRSIDVLRKRKLHYEDLSNLSENVVEESHTNYEIYSSDMIKKAIQGLKENHRIVLSLFLLEGYDHDEIADILKISNGASRTTYHRAKEHLKQSLISMKATLSEV